MQTTKPDPLAALGLAFSAKPSTRPPPEDFKDATVCENDLPEEAA